MRFQVPQFIDIEDKVIGPFTLKQFIIYVVAAMLLIPVYLFSELALFILIAIPIVGTAAVFAHVKINGKTFGTVLTNAAQFYIHPRIYIWRRTTDRKPFTIRDPEWDELIRKPQTQESTSSLNEIAQTLDTQGNVSKEDLEDPLTDEDADAKER